MSSMASRPRYVSMTGSAWARWVTMWRVRSSSLSGRVFSCFKMTSASYSSTDTSPTMPVWSRPFITKR